MYKMEVIESLKKEIADLHNSRTKLMKRKFRLGTKISIPAPITFKEYEEFVAVTRPSRSLNDVVRANVLEKLDLHRLTGIRYLDAEDSKFVVEMCFAVGPVYYCGFIVEVQNIRNESYHLVASNLPPGLELNQILKKITMKSDEDVRKFLQYVHICGCAFFDRKQQYKDLLEYIEDRKLAVDLFMSFNARYIEIKLTSDLLSLDSVEKEMVRFILKYSIDCVFPIKVTYGKNHISKIDESRLSNYVSYFMTFNLKETFRNILHYKAVKQQPPEDSQLHTRKTIVQSKIMDSVESNKQRNKVLSLSKENKSKNALNNEMRSNGSSKEHQEKSITPNTSRVVVTGSPEKNIRSSVQSKKVMVTPDVVPSTSLRKMNSVPILNFQLKYSTPLSQDKSNKEVPAKVGNLQEYFASEEISSISSAETVTLNFAQESQNVNPVAFSTPFPKQQQFRNLQKEPEYNMHRSIEKSAAKHYQSLRQPTLQEILKPSKSSLKQERKKTSIAPNESSQSPFYNRFLVISSDDESDLSTLGKVKRHATQELIVSNDSTKKGQVRRDKEELHDREEKMKKSRDDKKNEKSEVRIQAAIPRSWQSSCVMESDDESEKHEQNNQKSKTTILRDSSVQKRLQSSHMMTSSDDSVEDGNNQEKNTPSRKKTRKLLKQKNVSEEKRKDESEDDDDEDDDYDVDDDDDIKKNLERKVTVHKDTPVRRTVRQLHLNKKNKVSTRLSVVTGKRYRK